MWRRPSLLLCPAVAGVISKRNSQRYVAAKGEPSPAKGLSAAFAGSDPALCCARPVARGDEVARITLRAKSVATVLPVYTTRLSAGADSNRYSEAAQMYGANPARMRCTKIKLRAGTSSTREAPYIYVRFEGLP